MGNPRPQLAESNPNTCCVEGTGHARAAGIDAETVVDALLRWSRYAVPQSLLLAVAEGLPER